MLLFNKIFTRKPTATLSVIIVISLVVSLVFLNNPISALSGGDWRAGNIIEDGIFYNNNEMSTNDIQNLLNEKVPVCDTNGEQQSELGGGTRAQYGASRGYPAPYICLKNYFENPSTHQNNLSGTIPSGAQSAAQIIKQAADTHRINPKVLIVLLQKEQTLVTDTWPFSLQYRSATGYGCPDTAPCDTEYYGFYNQVNNAARQFRLYATYPSSYRYKPYQNNTIYYNPVASCGSSTVYVQNLATTGLYNYTPYQPNASALANLYTAGDSCGAYGNRNFWRLFNEWFGDTNIPYIATYHSQTQNLTLATGQSGSVSFKFTNSGSGAWKDDVSAVGSTPRVHLATSGPVNRASRFSAGWPSSARPSVVFSKVYESDGTTLAADQHTVNPGQIGEFSFTVTVPDGLQPGKYEEVIQPVRDGASMWDMRSAASTHITIVPKYKASLFSQSTNYLQSRQNMQAGTVSAKFTNSGSGAWKDDVSAVGSTPRVHLATSGPVNRASRFSAGWPSSARPSVVFSKVYESDGTTLAADQHTVNPGQIGEFSFTVTVPDGLSWSTYNESFLVVADGYEQWDMSAGVSINIRVDAVNHIATFAGQSVYPQIVKNSTGTGFLKYKNSGNSVWYDDVSAPVGVFAVHLATDSPVNRTSSMAYNWINPARPNHTFTAVYESDGTTLSADQHAVNPGQIAKFDITFQNNSLNAGQISREFFNPVLDGSSRWKITKDNFFVWLDVTGK